MKVHCGENSIKGEKAAYTLVDFGFSRNLMTLFSWGGNIKKGHQQKKCFKQYENVINIFYNVVKTADPSYTKVEMKNFFQNKVLTHAVRRNTNEVRRSSQPKFRANKVNTSIAVNKVEKGGAFCDGIQPTEQIDNDPYTVIF